MSDTIDLGIDLGTTNSVIASCGGGEVSVIKNNDGWDITPSAIWMPKPNQIHVGRQAKNYVYQDPANAAAEFKQEMGLADVRRSFEKAGVSLTPQELSAEVLKSLRADAAHDLGVAPDAAVITVPAAFGLNQNKATTEAATLAGFDAACPLVQEPTAAAFAYGVHKSSDRAYWMVFDFGGGTFDAAVVSKHEEDLRVLNHVGDPFLGGKLIDWAIVQRVLAPAVSSAFGLEGFERTNSAFQVDFALLKQAAEEAKIQLSRRESADITVELPTPGETFEYTLRRDEVDSIAEPFYTRAINMCSKALSDASLGPDDIDRLLLVGGVTLAPGLRELLADQTRGPGIELDWSLDPTVVVARGAAIFASTVRRPRRAPTTVEQDEYAVDLAYEPRVTTTTPTVGGKLRASGTVDWSTYSVSLSNPNGRPPFHSGRIPLSANGAFLTEVEIDRNQSSTFVIELTDGTGTPCPVTPNSVTITRGAALGGVKLAHSLGVQLADREFDRVLEKGATLPTTGRQSYRTSGPLRRNDPEAEVQIPVVQGERRRGDRNRQVGMLRIQPKDVRIDLPAGSEVEITFEVDESNLVTVFADVPIVDTQFELEANLEDVRPTDPPQLREMLREAEDRLASLRTSAAGAGSSAADDHLTKLDEESAVTTAREQVRAAEVDVGAAATAEDRLRDLHAELDDVEAAIGLPELIQELQELLAAGSELVDQVGQPSDRQELTDLRARADDAIRSQDSAAVRAQIERTGAFVAELERRHPDYPARLFYTLQGMVPPSGQVDGLLDEGRRAMAAGDRTTLDGVNQRLIRLLPREEQEKIIGVERM